MTEFIRIKEVMQMTALGRSTVWLWVKQHKLPAPIKLSNRVTVWKKSDIVEWQEQQMEREVA